MTGEPSSELVAKERIIFLGPKGAGPCLHYVTLTDAQAALDEQAAIVEEAIGVAFAAGRDAEQRELRARYAGLVAACQGVSCDLHCGIPAIPGPTYCFTCHEQYPCTGEEIRKALAALGQP